MRSQVCSIYLFRDQDTLELCATEGLNAAAVHQTRMRIGEGLVGRVARYNQVINTANAPLGPKAFASWRKRVRKSIHRFSAFQSSASATRLGSWVVQSKEAREFSADEIYALEVVAMVLAEMTELGAFVGDGDALSARHQKPVMFQAKSAQDGVAEGLVYLHERRVVVTNPIADDPEVETQRLEGSALIACAFPLTKCSQMRAAVMPSNWKSSKPTVSLPIPKGGGGVWKRTSSAAFPQRPLLKKEQSAARSRMGQSKDSYLRERLHDLDDLSNRLLRLLTGQGSDTGAEVPPNPILVARNIGPRRIARLWPQLARDCAGRGICRLPCGYCRQSAGHSAAHSCQRHCE